MAENQKQMVGDPSLGDLNLDDIQSVGTATPPPPEPQTPPAPSGNGQQQEPPPQDPNTATPPPTGEGGEPPKEPQAPPAEPPTPQTPTSQEPPQEPQPTSEPAATPPSDPWEPVLTTLNNELGAQYQDQNQLVGDLTAYQQYKQDPYANLPVEVKAHIEFLNSGGNTNEFYRLKSMNFKDMSDKEVLFQAYLRDHPEHAANMDFARMDFDRNYKATYGIIDAPKKTISDFTTTNDDEEQVVDHGAWNQYQQDYDYWNQKRSVESNIARNKLVSWQEKATTPENPQTGMTEEQAQAFHQQHLNTVSQIKATYKGEAFPISDKPEENLNLGLSDSVRQTWEQDLLNPMPLFNELGLMNDGQLDMEKFKRTAFIHRIWPQLGPIVSKLILENNTRQTVTGQQVNPTQQPPQGTPPPGDAHGDDEMAEVAEAFYQQKQERMRQSRGYTG